MHLDDTPGAVGDAVVVAADRYQAIMADRRSSLSSASKGTAGRLCSSSCSAAKASATIRCVVPSKPHIGDGGEPIVELRVEVVEIAEAASQEETAVLACSWFWPGGPTSSRIETIVPAERNQRTIIDDAPVGILDGQRRLHAVVENLKRHPADGAEGLHVTAQQRLQYLLQPTRASTLPE